MITKKCFIYGLGFAVGLLCLVSIIILLTESNSQSEPANLFEMSLEELMEIEITTVSQKKTKAIKTLPIDDFIFPDLYFDNSHIL